MGNKQSTGTEMGRVHDELENKLRDSNATPISFPLEYLKAITDNFSFKSELGRGGYGVVYKGVLPSQKIIAVKKLFEIQLKEDMFQKEVSYLMGIKHKNIVQFVGYCAESKWEAMEHPSGSGKHILAEIPKRLLCFEYVPNRSLNTHVSDVSVGLEWNMRFDIIKGVCNGLHFLHNECHIVHLDLKPENILMDSTMTPKIADFGLSRIFGDQQSRVVTENRAGTRGYMAPEYLDQGVVSNKADIFSFGVIVIEIITGRRDYPYFQQDCQHSTTKSLMSFTEEVLGRWRKNFLCTPKYKPMEIYIQQIRQCITIALNCVDPSMEKRPTTKDIIQMLHALDQYAKPPLAKIISIEKTRVGQMSSLDVHQTEPLILTSHKTGYIGIWNYDTRVSMGSVQTCGDVNVIKFIERKEWFVVGSGNGFIYVYNYKKGIKRITSFDAGKEGYSPVTSLDVHPTKPYVMSTCGHGVKLWDWDQNWECIQVFLEPLDYSLHLTFNPNDTNSFASASNKNTVKIWSLDPPKRVYILSGHQRIVTCLNFFTRGDRQCLVTGSFDRTAKIWDMTTKACIYTLEGFMSSVTSVISHPSSPLLVTGSANGDIHFWSALDFRLLRILKNSDTGSGNGACLMGPCTLSSNKVVIGSDSALWMMEITDEEPDAGQCSNQNSK